MESVEGSLKQMGENVSSVQVAAVPGLAKWGQNKLDECQGRWDTLSKQVRGNLCVCTVLCPATQKKHGLLFCAYSMLHVCFTSKPDVISLQLLSHQERVAESRERQVNLRKDLAEMQEWMTQVDEEFLMRDFEYKSPEELEASLEEMKVRMEAGI